MRGPAGSGDPARLDLCPPVLALTNYVPGSVELSRFHQLLWRRRLRAEIEPGRVPHRPQRAPHRPPLGVPRHTSMKLDALTAHRIDTRLPEPQARTPNTAPLATPSKIPVTVERPTFQSTCGVPGRHPEGRPVRVPAGSGDPARLDLCPPVLALTDYVPGSVELSRFHRLLWRRRLRAKIEPGRVPHRSQRAPHRPPLGVPRHTSMKLDALTAHRIDTRKTRAASATPNTAPLATPSKIPVTVEPLTFQSKLSAGPSSLCGCCWLLASALLVWCIGWCGGCGGVALVGVSFECGVRWSGSGCGALGERWGTRPGSIFARRRRRPKS